MPLMNRLKPNSKGTRPEGTCYKHLRMDAFQFLHISLPMYLPHMRKPARKKSSSNFFVHLLQKSKVKWWWFFLVMRWFLATQVLYHDDSTIKYIKADHLDTKYAFTLQILWRIIWNFAGMTRQLLPKHPWRKQFEGHISTQIQSRFQQDTRPFATFICLHHSPRSLAWLHSACFDCSLQSNGTKDQV